MTTKTLLSWSSGKDAAWALQLLRKAPETEVVGLLTTVNESLGEISMHGVRERLLELQAEAAGLPLWKVPLPSPCPNDLYEARMAELMARMQEEGIGAVAYGDLFLAEIRAYREARHAGTGVEAIFPLWERPTSELAREMLEGGLQARLSCVDTSRLDPRFAGRSFDLQLLQELPPTVDPCGENGEFHTFVWNGPMFRRPIPLTLGEVALRDGFAYSDLKPAP